MTLSFIHIMFPDNRLRRESQASAYNIFSHSLIVSPSVSLCSSFVLLSLHPLSFFPVLLFSSSVHSLSVLPQPRSLTLSLSSLPVSAERKSRECRLRWAERRRWRMVFPIDSGSRRWHKAGICSTQATPTLLISQGSAGWTVTWPVEMVGGGGDTGAFSFLWRKWRRWSQEVGKPDPKSCDQGSGFPMWPPPCDSSIASLGPCSMFPSILLVLNHCVVGFSGSAWVACGDSACQKLSSAFDVYRVW